MSFQSSKGSKGSKSSKSSKGSKCSRGKAAIGERSAQFRGRSRVSYCLEDGT